MPRHFKMLFVGAVLFAFAIVSCDFGPRYELNKFDDSAIPHEGLHHTGAHLFTGVGRWLESSSHSINFSVDDIRRTETLKCHQD